MTATLPNTIHEWVTFLEAQDVPVLRRTSLELEKLRPSAERISASKLAVVILRDPLMTLKLLRLANSSRRGRLSNEITSVEHAIMMLGVVPLFKHFSSLVVLEDMLAQQEQTLNSVLQVFSRALHAAYQARQWALQHQDIRVEEVYISALLHDMTNMMLWIYAPQRAQEIRATVRRERVYYGLAHEKVMGFSVADFRTALAAAWRFPDMLAELVDCRNAGQSRAQGVLLAVSIAHLAERGWYGTQIEATLEAMADTPESAFGRDCPAGAPDRSGRCAALGVVRRDAGRGLVAHAARRMGGGAGYPSLLKTVGRKRSSEDSRLPDAGSRRVAVGNE